MKKSFLLSAILLLALAALLLLSGSFFIVPETEQAILTQFGQPVGAPITQAGVHAKIPFIQEVHRLDKRILEWDGASAEMPTKDKLYVIVDTFARWRITDPTQFFVRLRDERSAQSRLDDILGSETRNTVARHELVEVIRTTKGRQAVLDDTLVEGSGSLAAGLPPIKFGRVTLEKEISEQARIKMAEFGVELLDVRFKRVNYNEEVARKIYERMISERQQIAERFRSEGAGEAARILGSRDRDINQISSEAYRKVQTIQGQADAEATSIYAAAYNRSPEARDFYSFTRSLETYETAFQKETTFIFTTEDSFFHYLKGTPAPAPALPTPPPNL